MINVLFANESALSAVPVVFVSLLAVVFLLCVRAACGMLHITLTRLVAKTLDSSIAVLFVLYVVLVIVRFKTIG